MITNLVEQGKVRELNHDNKPSGTGEGKRVKS